LKHFSNSICSDALLISSMLVKRRLLKVSFIFWKLENFKRSSIWWIWRLGHDYGVFFGQQVTNKQKGSFGMNIVVFRFMPKTFEKFLWHEPIDVPNSSTISLIVTRRSFITIFSTFFHIFIVYY
jgi:hypothetical protein